VTEAEGDSDDVTDAEGDSDDVAVSEGVAEIDGVIELEKEYLLHDCVM